MTSFALSRFAPPSMTSSQELTRKIGHLRGVLENGPAATRSFSAAGEQCIGSRASVTRSSLSPPMRRASSGPGGPVDIFRWR